MAAKPNHPDRELYQVRRSRIQGRGVFARVDIPAGARIIEYTGERISTREADRRYDDEGKKRHHTFLFSVGPRSVIDASVGGNDARFINHACAPNCEAVVERRRVFIDARRAIAAGEELTYDYGYWTDPVYTDEDLRRIYPCRCGARSCRGTIAAPRPKKKRAPTRKLVKQSARSPAPRKKGPSSR
jgi:SET domain-containing protein